MKIAALIFEHSRDESCLCPVLAGLSQEGSGIAGMKRGRGARRSFKNRRFAEVYGTPPCATDILAAALGIDHDAARTGLIALIKSGFFIGPREPTNSMLVAYMEAIYPAPSTPSSSAQAVGNARRRWRAMAIAGTAIAMSKANSERGGMVDAAGLNPAGETLVGSSPTARTNGGSGKNSARVAS